MHALRMIWKRTRSLCRAVEETVPMCAWLSSFARPFIFLPAWSLIFLFKLCGGYAFASLGSASLHHSWTGWMPSWQCLQWELAGRCSHKSAARSVCGSSACNIGCDAAVERACVRVRFHIIRNARIENVGKSQSCMVSKLRIIWKQTVDRTRQLILMG